MGCRWGVVRTGTLGLLWRAGGEAGEGLAAPLAGSGRQAERGSARGAGLAGAVGSEDALVADGKSAAAACRC